MEYWWSIFLTISIIIFCIITPIILYYLHQFWKYRHFDVVAKRRPSLVIAFAILTLINILFIRTYFAILSNLSYSGYTLGILNDPRIRTPAIWFTQLSASLLLFRIWIIFYDWRRAVHILQLKWSKQLVSNQQQHWILKYAHLLGNEKLLIIISIIHYIGGVILCLIIIEVNNGENGLMYDLIIILDGLIIAIPFCILSFVSQKFHDNLGVRDEIRGIAIIFMIGVLGFVSGAFISKDTIIRSQGSYAWTAIISLCIVLRLLFVKRLQNYLDMNVNNTPTMVRVLRSFSTHTHTKDKNDENNENNKEQQKIAQFHDVLKCEEGFKIFANHLLKEYSVETLLFLLELQQIKRAIIDHYRELFASHHSKQYSDIQQDIEKAIDTISYKIDISPQILHLNDDVYKNITIDKVINLWTYLYQQYIDESSNATINISHSVRLSILSHINKHNLLKSDSSNNIKNTTNIVVNNDNNNNNNNNNNDTNIDKKKHLELIPVHSRNSLNSVSSSCNDLNSEVVENKKNKKQIIAKKYKLKSHNIIMELITSFDCAAKEIYTLLETDPWQRFKTSPEFKIWKQQFFDPKQPGNRKFTLSVAHP